MNRWAGVQSIFSGSPPLKQEALIFNQIGVIGLNFVLALVSNSQAREILRLRPRPEIYDLLWLIEQGIIFDVDERIPENALIESEELNKYEALRQEQIDRMINLPYEATNNRRDVLAYLDKRAKIADKAEEYSLRSVCVQLRELCNIEAYPILWNELDLSEDSQAEKSDVIQIVLKALPIPDESTPWEQILEYRSDPDSYGKFLDLRNWMNEISRGVLTPIEIEQKLEHLISQYQRRMAVHKMKTNTGTLKTFIVTSLEILEDLAHLNFGKVTKTLFSFKHRQIALIEGELTSARSEVAYVIKTEQAFTRNGGVGDKQRS
jgi:hypothetical protein